MRSWQKTQTVNLSVNHNMLGFLSALIRLFSKREQIPIPPSPPDVSYQTVIAEINRVREPNRLAPLTEDAKLNYIARSWAITMALRNILEHGDFFTRIASVYPNAAVSENIAEGQTSAAQVVADWMMDPPHRKAILGDYNRIGVGVSQSSQGTLYWVADFALV